MSPTAAAAPLDSPQSPGDAHDPAFAAIWGSQMEKLDEDDSEEEEADGSSMPPPPGGFIQPAAFQMQGGGFQTGAPEELFWANGGKSGQGGHGGVPPHFPMPTGPTGGGQPGQEQQQELFWGSGGLGGGLGGGIFSTGGIPGGQSLPGAGAHLPQGNQATISGGWNMGGSVNGFPSSGMSSGGYSETPGFKGEIDVANQASSPSEYQSQFLVGDSLSALLDDE